MPQEERAQIDAVQHRLAQKFAEVRHDHVVGVVQGEYARFQHSKVRDFIPLLVERSATQQLAKSTEDRQPGARSEDAITSGQVVDTGHMVKATRRHAATRWRSILGVRRSELLRWVTT